MLLETDRRFKHYKENEDRIILKDGLLFCNYYGETGSVEYYQLLIPKQIVDEVLRSLHGEYEIYPGITKTKIAYREKYFYPNIAQLIGEWVLSCQQCIRESRIDRRLNRLPCKFLIMVPEDAIQINLVPNSAQSSGYEWQPWRCSLAIFLPTLHPAKTPKQLPKS